MEVVERKPRDTLKLTREIVYLVIAFVFPLVLISVLIGSSGISLFAYEGNTMIMSDMQSQYICYLRSFRNLLLNNGSFVYTTETVFGTNYMSIFTYYLASPFNYLVVLFDETALPLFFVWSSILKMSFAGFNFYLLARFSGKFTFQKLICALGYGLISYSFVYMFNFMWLDGVMILPLVILGLHFLKEKRHLWLYPLALAYSLMTSWYIGFMICMFVVFYFFSLFFGDLKKDNLKDNLLFALRFAIFSLLGGFLAATFWLTAFLHLEGTKGTASLPKDEWYSLSSVLAGFGESNYAKYTLINQYNSYISMFVGVVPLAFAITYFCNKEFSWKERVVFFLIVAFYLLASHNSILAAILHGGKEPTFFPGRYSFLIGFLVCYLGSRSLDEAAKLHPLFYLVPLLFGIAALLILKNVAHSERLEYYPISTPSAVMYFVSIGFAAIISTIQILPFQQPHFAKVKNLAPYALLGLVVVEAISLYRGGQNVLETNKQAGVYQKYETYLEDCSYDDAFSRIKEYEASHEASPFYRMETTFNRPGQQNQISNNPMFYGYSGLSSFTSSSKKDVENYLLKIGYHYNGFFEKYDGGSTYAINSLMGIKYLMEDKSSAYNIHPQFLDFGAFEKLELGGDKNVHYYHNPYAVSLAFSSDKTNSTFINEGRRLSEDYVYWFDHFEYQNQMFQALDRSIGKNIFHPLEIDSITTSIAYTVDEGGLRTYKDVKSGDAIVIHFHVQDDGIGKPLYFGEKSQRANINYFIDGKYYEINTYWHKGIYSFPDTYNHNHTLTIRFTKPASSIQLRPELYYEDLSVSKEYLASAKSQEVHFTSVENGLNSRSYKGTIDIQKNNKHLIFTLPYEENIHVYVDKKEVPCELKWNIFTAIDLSEFELGEHEVSIVYKDSYALMAFPVFLVSALSFVPIILFYNRLEQKLFYRKKKEPGDQEPQ